MDVLSKHYLLKKKKKLSKKNIEKRAVQGSIKVHREKKTKKKPFIICLSANINNKKRLIVRVFILSLLLSYS